MSISDEMEEVCIVQLKSPGVWVLEHVRNGHFGFMEQVKRPFAISLRMKSFIKIGHTPGLDWRTCCGARVVCNVHGQPPAHGPPESTGTEPTPGPAKTTWIDDGMGSACGVSNNCGE